MHSFFDRPLLSFFCLVVDFFYLSADICGLSALQRHSLGDGLTRTWHVLDTPGWIVIAYRSIFLICFFKYLLGHICYWFVVVVVNSLYQFMIYPLFGLDVTDNYHSHAYAYNCERRCSGLVEVVEGVFPPPEWAQQCGTIHDRQSWPIMGAFASKVSGERRIFGVLKSDMFCSFVSLQSKFGS